MKHELLAGLALTTAAFVAGSCAADTIHESIYVIPPAAVAPPIEDGAINLDVLPMMLPAAVVAREQSSVLITASTPTFVSDNRSGLVEKIENGSGVRIAPTIFLSAGHLAFGSNNKPLKSTDICGGLEVFSSGPKPGVATNDDGRLIENGDLVASQVAGSYRNNDEGNTPDAAVIETPDNDGVLPPFHPLAIADQSPQIGDSLYYINYEPEANGDIRVSNQSLLTPTEIASGLSKPAIFGAIVIGYMQNGDIMVATGLRGYNAASQDGLARQGSSGGPIYNTAGQLVGISIEGPKNDRTFDLEALMKITHIAMYGADPYRQLNFSIIQPVSSLLLAKLGYELQTAPACQPLES